MGHHDLFVLQLRGIGPVYRLRQRGNPTAARRAFMRGLEADPFLPEALGNAGLLALELGEQDAARELLARLRAISAGGASPEERALAAALSR